jgi:hypothetical protein
VNLTGAFFKQTSYRNRNGCCKEVTPWCQKRMAPVATARGRSKAGSRSIFQAFFARLVAGKYIRELSGPGYIAGRQWFYELVGGRSFPLHEGFFQPMPEVNRSDNTKLSAAHSCFAVNWVHN